MRKFLRELVSHPTTKIQRYFDYAAVTITAVAIAYILRITVDQSIVHLFDVNLAFTDFVSALAAINIKYIAEGVRQYIRNRNKNQITLDDVVHGINTRAIYPVFQPVLKLSTNEIVGFEVLARMDHPKYGAVNPIEFVHLVDAAPPEITQQFTEYMLREAAHCYHILERHGKEFQMSLNVSSNDLVDARVVTSISRALVQYDMPFDRLTLEASEASLMKDLNQAIKVLASLDTLDVKLALDDYGTHIVSFLRFSRGMWVDEIKVGSKLACNIESPAHQELMLAILRTARDTGIQVTVIRVKNEQELETARKLGCDRVQGDVIARPMAIEELITWMKHNDYFSNRPN